MAAKTQYTKDFREKVVEEYRKGNLILEEVAAKYGIPAALLQDWVNKADLGNIYVNYINKPIEKNIYGQRFKQMLGWLIRRLRQMAG